MKAKDLETSARTTSNKELENARVKFSIFSQHQINVQNPEDSAHMTTITIREPEKALSLSLFSILSSMSTTTLCTTETTLPKKYYIYYYSHNNIQNTLNFHQYAGGKHS